MAGHLGLVDLLSSQLMARDGSSQSPRCVTEVVGTPTSKSATTHMYREKEREGRRCRTAVLLNMHPGTSAGAW